MDIFITLLVCGALLVLMFLYFRNQINQSLNATSLLRDVQLEVDGMVKELNLSAERNIGLLEERIVEMESLLAQADQKVVLLARELEKREKAAEVYSHLKKPVAEPRVEKPAPTSPQLSLLDTPQDAVPEAVKPKSLKERVLELRAQNLPPEEIALKSGATLGEVELILSLNPRAGEPV